MTTKNLKEKIWEYEFYHNGFHKLSGADVKVVNVRKHKDKVIADVTLIDDCGTGHSEQRFNNCEYPLTLLK